MLLEKWLDLPGLLELCGIKFVFTGTQKYTVIILL